MPSMTNARKPVGIGGELTLRRMNKGAHAELSEWGFTHAKPSKNADCVDLGCGGGANIARLLAYAPEGTAKGLDYSDVSVSKSRRLNRREVRKGRCQVVKGDVSELPFGDASLDFVTAFETVYFWPDIGRAFAEVFRVLRSGGEFMVCNEADGTNPEQEKWIEEIGEMAIYTEGQLREALERAGFGEIRSAGDPEKNWLVVIARKARAGDRRASSGTYRLSVLSF